MRLLARNTNFAHQQEVGLRQEQVNQALSSSEPHSRNTHVTRRTFPSRRTDRKSHHESYQFRSQIDSLTNSTLRS